MPFHADALRAQHEQAAMIKQLSEMECPKLNSKLKEFMALPHMFEDPIRIPNGMPSL